MVRPSPRVPQDPKFSARVTGSMVFVTLEHLSDAEQEACLQAVRTKVDEGATMDRGVITCTVSAEHTSPHRRDTAAHQLKRSALAHVRLAVHNIRAQPVAREAKSSKPKPKQPKRQRELPRRGLAYQY